jgi:hypothetical protein
MLRAGRREAPQPRLKNQAFFADAAVMAKRVSKSVESPVNELGSFATPEEDTEELPSPDDASPEWLSLCLGFIAGFMLAAIAIVVTERREWIEAETSATSAGQEQGALRKPTSELPE